MRKSVHILVMTQLVDFSFVNVISESKLCFVLNAVPYQFVMAIVKMLTVRTHHLLQVPESRSTK